MIFNIYELSIGSGKHKDNKLSNELIRKKDRKYSLQSYEYYVNPYTNICL
jgi:hypothetical protein